MEFNELKIEDKELFDKYISRAADFFVVLSDENEAFFYMAEHFKYAFCTL